jgi:hypothetical protein
VDRKNINRGFKKLRVWQDAVSLYILAWKILSNFPFELKKAAASGIDAAPAFPETSQKVTVVAA